MAPAKPPPLSRARAPAIPVAAALAGGVWADQWLLWDVRLWLAATLFSIGLWIALCRSGRTWTAAVCLLLSVSTLGGAWHHWRWSVVGGDHIAGWTRDGPVPVKLRGTLSETPVIVPRKEERVATGIPQFDRTICTLNCVTSQCGQDQLPVSGNVRVEISGHALDAWVGDEVEISGQLSRPPVARNPGGFDFRAYLRVSGIHAILRADEPACLRVIESRPGVRRLFSHWRRNLEALLQSRLSERTRTVGVAMLLGSRGQLPDEIKDAFQNSGLMHVLAISGMHVTILAGLLGLLCRLLELRPNVTVGLVLTGVVGYTLLTDGQPPVLRSLWMIVVFLAGRPWFRQASAAHNLALSGLLVLAVNPSHLFDIGAQLSFLAVAGLIWVEVWPDNPTELLVRGGVNAAQDESVDLVEPVVAPPIESPTWQQRMLGRARDFVHLGLKTTLAVWVLTLPLMVRQFHVVSPIGFVMNLIVGPLSIFVLWAGYLLMAVGWLIPPLALPFGWCYDGSLHLLLLLVQTSVELPGGYFRVAGVPDWWTAGYYLLLAAWYVGRQVDPRWMSQLAERLEGSGTSLVDRMITRTGEATLFIAHPAKLWRPLMLWMVVGLGVWLWPGRPDGLRCTFLSVGHGLAVFIELPGGRALLYDAGQLQDADRAQEIVETALWRRGRSKVDAMVLSHADVDHFNGAPGLLEAGAVKSVVMHPSFLDLTQSGVVSVSETCSAQGVPIKLVWAGDHLSYDADVKIEVLHPAVKRNYAIDNANSLVLRVEYAGRSLLFTGDLEAEGLAALLRKPRMPVDVMLAPHHGSRTANTEQLAAWANPQLVIASSGSNVDAERLQATYVNSTIATTQDRGAIEVSISPDGAWSWSGWLK